MALEERLQQELQENPVLEVKEGTRAEHTGAEDNDSDHDPLEDFDGVWEHRYNDAHRPSRSHGDEEGDRKHAALHNTPARPQSLHDYLSNQLALLDSTPEQLRLLRFLITHVDEKGYLTVSAEEIAKTYDQPVRVTEVEEAFRMVQKLEPPGIGARNEKECLLLQLTPETPHYEVLSVLISHHLEDLAHNRLPLIQRRTGFALATIQQAIEVLKRLTLRPAARFTTDHIPYVVPDVAVALRDDGDYEVRLLDTWMPSMNISRCCLELYRDRSADPKTREYLKRKI
jgi:RNA polymerase sigma-54 factor